MSVNGVSETNLADYRRVLIADVATRSERIYAMSTHSVPKINRSALTQMSPEGLETLRDELVTIEEKISYELKLKISPITWEAYLKTLVVEGISKNIRLGFAFPYASGFKSPHAFHVSEIKHPQEVQKLEDNVRDIEIVAPLILRGMKESSKNEYNKMPDELQVNGIVEESVLSLADKYIMMEDEK